MKTFIPIILIALIALESCNRCGGDSQDTETKYFSESGFTEVEAGGSFDVKIIQGDEYSVAVTAGDKVLSRVDVKKKGDRLIFRMDGIRFRSCSRDVNITVVMPELRAVKSSGGSYFYSDGELSGSSLNIDASGGSQVDLDLDYGSVDIEGSGGSKVDLNGSCSDLEIDMSGGSQLNLYDLQTSSCEVDGSGGSKVEVSVRNNLSVDLSGGCQVYYKGSPSVSSKTSGGSSVEKK